MKATLRSWDLQYILLQCEEALRQAKAHVHRQQHGRHEQDRADAKEWLEQWTPLIAELALLVPILKAVK